MQVSLSPVYSYKERLTYMPLSKHNKTRWFAMLDFGVTNYFMIVLRPNL